MIPTKEHCVIPTKEHCVVPMKQLHHVLKSAKIIKNGTNWVAVWSFCLIIGWRASPGQPGASGSVPGPPWAPLGPRVAQGAQGGPRGPRGPILPNVANVADSRYLHRRRRPASTPSLSKPPRSQSLHAVLA